LARAYALVFLCGWHPFRRDRHHGNLEFLHEASEGIWIKEDGPWRNILTEDVIETHDLALTATLGPWQTRVFIREEGNPG